MVSCFVDEFSVDGEISAALDVLALAEANIAFGIRERTVSRGMDPAELAGCGWGRLTVIGLWDCGNTSTG